MSVSDFRTYPSWGRDVIECMTQKAEKFFEAYCNTHMPCPLEDEPSWVDGLRRFLSPVDDFSGYHDGAVVAAEAAGLINEDLI